MGHTDIYHRKLFLRQLIQEANKAISSLRDLKEKCSKTIHLTTKCGHDSFSVSLSHGDILPFSMMSETKDYDFQWGRTSCRKWSCSNNAISRLNTETGAHYGGTSHWFEASRSRFLLQPPWGQAGFFCTSASCGSPWTVCCMLLGTHTLLPGSTIWGFC